MPIILFLGGLLKTVNEQLSVCEVAQADSSCGFNNASVRGNEVESRARRLVYFTPRNLESGLVARSKIEGASIAVPERASSNGVCTVYDVGAAYGFIFGE